MLVLVTETAPSFSISGGVESALSQLVVLSIVNLSIVPYAQNSLFLILSTYIWPFLLKNLPPVKSDFKGKSNTSSPPSSSVGTFVIFNSANLYSNAL